MGLFAELVRGLPEVVIPENECLSCGAIFKTEGEYSVHTAEHPDHRVRRRVS